jgi:hypothetical protein
MNKEEGIAEEEETGKVTSEGRGENSVAGISGEGGRGKMIHMYIEG